MKNAPIIAKARDLPETADAATPDSVDSNAPVQSRFIDDSRATSISTSNDSHTPSSPPTFTRRTIITDAEASAAAEAAAAAAVAAVASAGSFPVNGATSLADIAAAAAAASGSRTQQRIWLRRVGLEPEEEESRRRTTRRGGEHVDALSKELKNVKRYRDPVVESLERVRVRVVAASVGLGGGATQGVKSKWFFAGGNSDEQFAAALVKSHDRDRLNERYNDRRPPQPADIAMALERLWSGRWRLVDDVPEPTNGVSSNTSVVGRRQ
ncbi:hypothetical protein V1512DRAFT_209775 [Lipomyces arxii]|uniref:uncharacterized protein n=1 Tax=Lipomyces arxii TaxID=56418 RepID=UPI0034D00F22